MRVTTELYLNMEISDIGVDSPTLEIPKLDKETPEENAKVWTDFVDTQLKSLISDIPIDEDKLGFIMRERYIDLVRDRNGEMPENQSMINENKLFPKMDYFAQKYGDESYKLFEEYTRKIFRTKPEDDKKLLALNTEEILNLENLLKNPETATKELKNAKSMLALLMQQYYIDLNLLIDDDKLEDLRSEVIGKINNFENEKGETVHRQNTMIALNGQVLAGKGTTMGILGMEAPVETGTAGILGAGTSHEHWKNMSKLTQFQRDEGLIPSDKVVTSMLMLELAKRREDMDNDGKVNDPIVISGFPRSESQANQLRGIDGIKAVYLDMSATENARRTIRRIIESIGMNRINGTSEAVRGDDIGSIFIADAQGKPKDENQIQGEIQNAIAKVDTQKLKDVSSNAFKLGSALIENSPELQKLFEEVQLGEKARWHTYNKTKQQIAKALEKIGVNQKDIMVDGKPPKQVAEEVKSLI